MLLYVALVGVRPAGLPEMFDEGRVEVATGFLWLAVVVRVTVLFTVLSAAGADCLFTVALGVVTLAAVTLPLETDDDEPARVAADDWVDVVRPTLLAVATPPLVDTLLVNTLSEPVCLRSPCQRSSWWIGTVG